MSDGVERWQKGASFEMANGAIESSQGDADVELEVGTFKGKV
jgi:hypothetical protein